MSSNIKISIPAPCHENWAAMTPTDKGRFCGSCQKQVMDFTKASDWQIAESYQTEKHLCGRFLVSQLDRNLVVPKEKSTIWAAASAAVISFFVLGGQKAIAQGEPVKTEVAPVEKSTTNTAISVATKTIRGTVSDETYFPIPMVIVKNLSANKIAYTDIDGVYTMEASEGDLLEFSSIDLQSTTINVSSPSIYDIQLRPYEISTGIIIYNSEGRTFLGRIFYRIGRLFR